MTVEVSNISYERHWTALMTTIYADIGEGTEPDYDDRRDWEGLTEEQKDLLTYGDRRDFDMLDYLTADEIDQV
jgi:hypothetical protein